MNHNRYCVIMAGGVGARFWPKSRQSMPKQFLDMLGTGKSMLRHTYDRFVGLVPHENIIVVTNEIYRDVVMQQLPELAPSQLLCEPIGRNTAPTVCYASYSIMKRNPAAELVVTPADHYISDEAELRRVVGECFDFVAGNDALLTVGVRATRPETAYGYIQANSDDKISRVKSFTEKPNIELAQTFLQCGEFFWNSGIFVWKVRDIIAAIELYLEENHQLFSSIIDHYGTENEEREIRRIFSTCRSASIDHSLLERAQNVYVRVGDFGWSDVGSWGSVYHLTQKDEWDNVGGESCYMYDTRNSMVSIPKDKIAVLSGLDGYIVVDTDDVLMVCPRAEEQNIKKFIDELKYKKGDKFI